MAVYWYEQTSRELPAELDWLSRPEQERASQLRFPKRRDDWLLGRWTAKHAVAAFLALCGTSRTLRRVEIRAMDTGAPRVFVDGVPAPLEISISHRAGIAACAVTSAGNRLGCDLEWIEPRSEAFVGDYLSPSEQRLVADAAPEDRDRVTNLLWSAKESALKALRTGLRLPSRSVVVTFPEPSAADSNESTESVEPLTWHPLLVMCEDGQAFHGWWQQNGRLLRTLVASPRSPCPLQPLSQPNPA